MVEFTGRRSLEKTDKSDPVNSHEHTLFVELPWIANVKAAESHSWKLEFQGIVGHAFWS